MKLNLYYFERLYVENKETQAISKRKVAAKNVSTQLIVWQQNYFLANWFSKIQELVIFLHPWSAWLLYNRFVPIAFLFIFSIISNSFVHVIWGHLFWLIFNKFARSARHIKLKTKAIKWSEYMVESHIVNS